MRGQNNFIQQVFVVIEAGLIPGSLMHFTAMPEPIDSKAHYRDERAIADALRKLADRIEQGCMFEGVEFRRVNA